MFYKKQFKSNMMWFSDRVFLGESVPLTWSDNLSSKGVPDWIVHWLISQSWNHVIIHSNRLDVLKICKVRKIAYFVQSLKIFLLLGQSEQK